MATPIIDLKDGLYIVDRQNIYAAFVVRGGEVTNCAPILRKNLGFYKTVAQYVPTSVDPITPLHAASRAMAHGGDSKEPAHESEDQYPPVWRTGCY